MAKGGGGAGGARKSGGGGGQENTVTVKTQDKTFQPVTTAIKANPITQELSRGGTLQNTRLDVTDNPPAGFNFGKSIEVRGWSVDRRQPNINEINRGLRQETLKVKIHQQPGEKRVRFLDATSTPYYVEFE